MIKYDEVLKNQDRLGPFLSKEKTLVNNLRVSQDTLKKYIHTYIDQINATFANEEVFQNMLLASLQTALLQIDINIQDLINLSNIIDILKKEGLYSIEESITQYNKLYDKVEKNISIVREILQKTINSFDQLSAISSNSNLTTIDEQKLNEAKQAIIGSTEDLFPKEKKVERNIREIKDKSSSDLLCFFPKSDNDILAISTIQDTYSVLFDEESATVRIDKENFDFSIKTVGVQVSNAENVLLISREKSGYFLITNMPVEVPTYINVSKIDRNKNFLEIGIYNSSVSLCVQKNKLIFSDELEEETSIGKKGAKHAKTISVSPSEDEPIPEKIVKKPVVPIQPTKIGNHALADETIKVVDKTIKKEEQPIIEKEVVPVQKEIQPEEPKKVAVVQPEIKQTPIVEQPVQQEKKVQVVEQPVEEKVTTTIANTSDNDIDETDEDDDLPINIMKDNNTLIISEEDNQIILPYKLAEVQKQFKKNKKKYSSVKDLIENEYILPTDNFKNPVKSRFREAYQLIKKKEHGHLKEAIELGFELMFQSNLNPAVIAACKSLRELDIYLDCLDDNELDKFNCFNIVYNVPPSRKSSSKKRKKE